MQQTFHGKTIDFDRIPDISGDDAAFLAGLFERFPRVAEGYHRFTHTPSDERIPLAAKVLETQPRTGWRLRFEELPKTFRPVLATHAGEHYGNRRLMTEPSYSSSESVLEHCAEAQELFTKIYRNYPKHHRQWGAECMKFHDFHEAIDGDFTPHCPITKDEKKRLEGISTKLLCQAGSEGSLATRHVWNCTQLFEGHTHDFEAIRNDVLATIEAQRAQGAVKPHQEATVTFFENLYRYSKGVDTALLRAQTADIDALHMALRSCRMVKEGHIKPENLPKMEEFWTYVDKKLQTVEARKFFDAFRSAYLDDALNYPMAVTNAVNSLSGGRRL